MSDVALVSFSDQRVFNGTVAKERVRIRQGYLALPSDRDFEAFGESGPDDVPTVGRIRSIVDPDGGRPATFIHTLKIGSGLVRREKERPPVSYTHLTLPTKA